MIESHHSYTGSLNAKRILEHWEIFSGKFVRVIPKAYLKINDRISNLQNSGMTKFDAEMAAFEESKMS